MKLDIDHVRVEAATLGWHEIDYKDDTKTISFHNENEKPTRINVYLTRGTVGICIPHTPQEYRRNQSLDDLIAIFTELSSESEHDKSLLVMAYMAERALEVYGAAKNAKTNGLRFDQNGKTNIEAITEGFAGIVSCFEIIPEIVPDFESIIEGVDAEKIRIESEKSLKEYLK